MHMNGTDLGLAPRTKTHFNGVGKLRTYIKVTHSPLS
jgi:hypothetical protein